MKRFGRKHFTTTKGEIIKIIQDIVRTHVVMQNAKHSRPYTGSSLAYWEQEMNLQITYWKCPHCNTFFKRSELEGGHVVLMNQQEGEISKSILLCIGSCLFLIISTVALPGFFGIVRSESVLFGW